MTTLESVAAVRSLRYAQVEPDGIGDALIPLDAAAHWLHECGIEHWAESCSQARARAQLAEEVERGNVFTWYALDRPVATATISDWPDPDLVHSWPDPDARAQYLTGLAVSQAGRRLLPGLGARILEYAQVLTEIRGAATLRLDCVAGNERLRRYFYERGFDHVATVDTAHRGPAALFERKLR